MNIYENESRSAKQFFRCPLQNLHLIGGDAKTRVSLVHAAAHVVLAVLGALQGDAPQVEVVILRAGVEEDGVVLAGEAPLRRAAGFIVPYDFVDEVVITEYFIQQSLHVVGAVPVQVHPDAACVREQFLHEHEADAQHGQVLLQLTWAMVSSNLWFLQVLLAILLHG